MGVDGSRVPAPRRGLGLVEGGLRYADLDDIDRRILIALQRDGRASWRAIGDLVGASTATVARRGQALFARGVVKVVVNTALGAQGPVDSFLVRITCTPGRQLEVAAELAEHPDVRFITIVTGGFDIIAELVVEGGGLSFARDIEDLQSIDGVERWRSDYIMHVYKVAVDWSKQLFDETLVETSERSTAPISTPGYCAPTHFDDADWRILELLHDDGRETFSAIGAKLGMNESSVRRRFERMRKEGCVDVLTLVPAPALGMRAETLLTITVAPAALDAVAQKLAAEPSVRYVAAILDQNALFCEVIVPSTSDIYHFVTAKLARLDGVLGWNAAMELLYLKRGFVEAPWWRSQLGLPAPV